MTTNTSNNKPTISKELSGVALFALIFGSMMGSGVFDIPQNVAHQAGAIAVVISWIITAIGMLALGWAFSYITNKRPDIQSGIYGYAKYGLGDYVGFNSAWGYWLNAVLGNASYLIYIFATLGNFALFKAMGQGDTLTAFICESALIWLVYFLIIRGIKEASIVNIVISTVKILALGVIVAVFCYGFSWTKFSGNFTLDLHLGSLLTQIKSTMLVTVWDFIGIEAACIYALRAKNMRDVARATMFGVIVVLLIDMLISVLPFGIISSHMVSTLDTPSTAGVLGAVTGVFSAEIIRGAVIISVAGALLAWMMLATNIIYLAASDNTMPRLLAKIDQKEVPKNALLASSIILQIFIIAAFFTQSVYLAMIQLATSMVLIPYLLSAIFALKLIISDGKIDYLALIKGFIATIYGVWLIYAGGIKYLAFSSLLYAIGILVYIKARKEQQHQNLFATKAERAICAVIVLIAIASTYMWASGHMSLT